MPSKTQPIEGYYPGRPSVGHSLLIALDLNGEKPDSNSKSNLGFPRAACEGGPRPCPLVSCPYNNYLEVSVSTGHIRLAHGAREPEDVPPNDSCCLDVADRGPQTLEYVGEVLGLTRERIRQIEGHALRKLRSKIGEKLLLEWIEHLSTP